MPVRHWPNEPSEGSLFARQATPDHFLVAHIDGGARGNPGAAGYGVVVEDAEGKPVADLSEYLGFQTNNYAEYNGLLAALDFALTSGERNLRVLSDSELLVKQIKGQYKVSSPALKELYERAKKMIGGLEWFSIEHVRRERNKEADALANEAMDRKKPGQVVTRGGAKRAAAPAKPSSAREYRGVVKDGRVELIDRLPDGTRVIVKVVE